LSRKNSSLDVNESIQVEQVPLNKTEVKSSTFEINDTVEEYSNCKANDDLPARKNSTFEIAKTSEVVDECKQTNSTFQVSGATVSSKEVPNCTFICSTSKNEENVAAEPGNSTYEISKNKSSLDVNDSIQDEQVL